MTCNSRKRLSSVMMSSVMPSEKYSCWGSPLILSKGSTATDGLSGSASVSSWRFGSLEPPDCDQRHTWIGAAMFLTRCSPASTKTPSVLPSTSSWTLAEIRTSPGSAISSSRAAMLTPSPNRLPPSAMTSPRLTPMRRRIRRSSERSALRPSMSVWIAIAQRTASTGLANSATTLSPALPKTRPRWSAISPSMTSR